jgi:hypothetical protein
MGKKLTPEEREQRALEAGFNLTVLKSVEKGCLKS